MITSNEEDARDELAALGEAIGDASRASMLVALLGGVALPASDLARAAGVAPSTATSHLRRLVDAGLVTARAQGRHRYFALAGPRVADAVEQLATLRARPAPRTSSDAPIAIARTCYGHLAGRLAVAFWRRAADASWVRWSDDAVTLTDAGHAALARRGVIDEGAPLPATGRACIDWTERVPHVAGRLGVALCGALLARGWVKRVPNARVLRVTTRGAEGFAALGVRWLV